MMTQDIHAKLLSLCLLIEKIPGSEEQTAASVAANELLQAVAPTEKKEAELTLGERIVRVRFNPSATGLVDQLKQRHAELIDMVEAIPDPKDNVGWDLQHANKIECIRLLETSAMFAVKAATTGK